MTDYNFPDIDTSHWHLDDKAWQAERKAHWPVIERMCAWHKSKKGLTAIKQYYLKGKLPDWEKMADWGDMGRHVDLFMFLWLHPSWQPELLQTLYDQYMASDKVKYLDVAQGFSTLIHIATIDACCEHSEESESHVIQTDGHNELLFEIMMGNWQQREYPLARPCDLGSQMVFQFPQADLFSSTNVMSRWLRIANMRPINNDMLYQYDKPLEWWYQSVSAHQEDYFAGKSTQQEIVLKALWRIHHFDIDREGDSPRTRFLLKMRAMLDERPFIADFSEMWQAVKAGKVELENPWEL
ncbi:hypothetical protein GCM10011297_25360 [Bacterioplanes sanyensis]|uniref:hypothetical protein n=1 Tax=Bacterioplanes sanyensis TaxID=1249553 RepID=UPI00167A4B11|nr:hypothetical protein [Bacterioplanes sanyensis]GGY51341.1 hypothetical protein GCM10011297_25360 [Bacterioplanes sanyensis]